MTGVKDVAPYITAWSTEQDLPYQLVERPGCGVGYADELVTDRDSRGVLWQRAAVRRQVRRPEFGLARGLRRRSRASGLLRCSDGGAHRHASSHEPIEDVKGGQMDEFAHVFAGPAVLEVMREYTKEAGSSDTSDEYDEM